MKKLLCVTVLVLAAACGNDDDNSQDADVPAADAAAGVAAGEVVDEFDGSSVKAEPLRKPYRAPVSGRYRIEVSGQGGYQPKLRVLDSGDAAMANSEVFRAEGDNPRQASLETTLSADEPVTLAVYESRGRAGAFTISVTYLG